MANLLIELLMSSVGPVVKTHLDALVVGCWSPSSLELVMTYYMWWLTHWWNSWYHLWAQWWRHIWMLWLLDIGAHCHWNLSWPTTCDDWLADGTPDDPTWWEPNTGIHMHIHVHTHKHMGWKELAFPWPTPLWQKAHHFKNCLRKIIMFGFYMNIHHY